MRLELFCIVISCTSGSPLVFVTAQSWFTVCFLVALPLPPWLSVSRSLCHFVLWEFCALLHPGDHSSCFTCGSVWHFYLHSSSAFDAWSQNRLQANGSIIRCMTGISRAFGFNAPYSFMYSDEKDVSLVLFDDLDAAWSM